MICWPTSRSLATHYKVYIRWPGSGPDYKMGIDVTAESAELAAEKRIRLLVNPEKYEGLVVVGPVDATVFDLVPGDVRAVQR